MGYLDGFGVTIKKWIGVNTDTGKRVTLQYPEQTRPKPERFHGRHVLNRYDDGMEKCIGCELCAGVCPAKCIYVRGEDNDPDEPTSPGERFGFVYEINYLRCIHCDLCVEACPTEAITETKLFEFAFTNRADAIYTKDELLVGDDGRPQQLPWENWDGGFDPAADSSGWMRATAPSGAEEFGGIVAWAGELGYGVRAPEGGEIVEPPQAPPTSLTRDTSVVASPNESDSTGAGLFGGTEPTERVAGSDDVQVDTARQSTSGGATAGSGTTAPDETTHDPSSTESGGAELPAPAWPGGVEDKRFEGARDEDLSGAAKFDATDDDTVDRVELGSDPGASKPLLVDSDSDTIADDSTSDAAEASVTEPDVPLPEPETPTPAAPTHVAGQFDADDADDPEPKRGLFGRSRKSKAAPTAPAPNPAAPTAAPAPTVPEPAAPVVPDLPPLKPLTDEAGSTDAGPADDSDSADDSDTAETSVDQSGDATDSSTDDGGDEPPPSTPTPPPNAGFFDAPEAEPEPKTRGRRGFGRGKGDQR